MGYAKRNQQYQNPANHQKNRIFKTRIRSRCKSPLPYNIRICITETRPKQPRNKQINRG